MERKRPNCEEIKMIYELMAALSTLTISQKTLENRISMIPNGKRDFRMMEKVLENKLNDILRTIPVERLDTLRHEIQKVTYHVSIGKDYSQETIYRYIRDEDLQTLLILAHENCKICLQQHQCKKCQLGKLFDKIIMEINPEDTDWFCKYLGEWRLE